jgi:hypothetical protein
MSSDTYKFVGKFVDDNMPQRTAEGTESEVKEVAHDFCAQFGPAIKSVWIIEPDGSKSIFNGKNEYLFTVPPITAQEE